MSDTKEIQDKKGRQITLVMGDFEENCEAYHGDKRIGRFEFKEIESDGSGPDLRLVTYCFLNEQPGYTHCGIGREIVKFVAEYGHVVVMSHDDGQRRQDSSHLTGDAPGFADTLEKEKLICRY
jgi:hypothetical protein